ncbi:MAG: sigma-54-dependent Fis family transcriptional regulator [Labilithrix sp.]|nr:sigma-54-dependent Fis family transcriptional regulator [Labilithrix sp.]MCW5811365.1 sigma-54-dependent Fis family transcriptional regulator [Labilithrix sp.]
MSDVPHVLLVDDDQELCELLSIRIEAAGYRISVEHDVKGALARVGREQFDCVLLDLRLGNENGFDVLDGVAKRSAEMPVIMITAHGTIDLAVEAMKKGATGFVTKPFHDHDLLQKVKQTIEASRMRRELAGLRRLVGAPDDRTRLVGVSPAIERVREMIALVAGSDSTVLILGESGTGKELVARCIRALSSRKDGPFVAVNCAGLSAELLESTLFGHKRGAFTGAVADREGLFGAAKKGTLFLDEIGETPLEVQAKLLRVLQERRYTAVGSTMEQEADVRIIAATNRDLRQEIAEKRFREDLFYRLHVVPIAMPPIRDRADDIPLLAEMFLERAAARMNRPAPKLGQRALAVLTAHPWPGNVRELENVMEAAVLLCRSDELDVNHLPGIGTATSPAPAGGLSDIARGSEAMFAPYLPASAPAPPPLREARDAFERAYVHAILKRSGGNVTAAAKLAERNRTDFYDLMRRHGVTPRRD